jgi:hypothetical protein
MYSVYRPVLHVIGLMINNQHKCGRRHYNTPRLKSEVGTVTVSEELDKRGFGYIWQFIQENGVSRMCKKLKNDATI